MNIASLGSFLNNSIGSGFGNAIQGAALTNNNSGASVGATSSGQSSDSSQLSPLAQILSALQQVQQSNPAQYQQLTQLLASNLQNAAQFAQQNGDSAGANVLSQLSTDFTNAGKTGDLPNIKDLATALSSTGGDGSTSAGQLSIHIDFSQISESLTAQSASSTSGSQLQESLLFLQVSLSEPSANNAAQGASGPPSDSSLLSPLAQILNTLAQLQQSNPAEYEQLSALLALNVQNAAQAAQSNGDSAQANQLTQLATDLTNASNPSGGSNTQTIGDAVAGSGGHHHHHRHFQAAAGASSGGSSGIGQAAPQQLHESLLAYQISFSETSTNGNTTNQEAFSLSGAFAAVG